MKDFKLIIWLISLGIFSMVYLESRFFTRTEANERIGTQEKTNERIISVLNKLDKRLYDIHAEIKKE